MRSAVIIDTSVRFNVQTFLRFFLPVFITLISSGRTPCSSKYCRFGFSAPVGQTPTHCPHNTHVVSGMDRSKNVPICVSNPRPSKLMAYVYCASSAQTWTQRQHNRHFE